MATSDLKIVAKNNGEGYLLSAGDPRTDQGVLCFIVDALFGEIFDPPKPFDVCAKWDSWHLIPNDPTLLQKILTFPHVKG
jgi:hypothetical protein